MSTDKNEFGFLDEEKLKDIGNRLSEIGKKFLKAPTQKHVYIKIPDEHVIANKKVCTSIELEPEKHYFAVTVDELYLSYQSKLWVSLDPTALVTTELLYDDKKLSVPFVVGPSMMKNLKDFTSLLLKLEPSTRCTEREGTHR